MKTKMVVYFDKILVSNEVYYVCPIYKLPLPIDEVESYLEEVGDEFYIIDDELYIDSGALFNLTMKYCEEIDIIEL